MTALAAPLARLTRTAWELRRRSYALGLVAPHRVAARVVSVGNLAVGGAGKTTLTLWLARRARDRGVEAAVVCRRYAPGPGGKGDEELLYETALMREHAYAGRSKWRLARQAAAEGHRLLLVDDAFSHWALARDVDLVLLNADDPWAGGELLPQGRLREPRRALQRADAVVLSHARSPEHAEAMLAGIRSFAPGARFAAGRHRALGARGLDGASRAPGGPAVVVTGTGHPAGVQRTARALGYDVLRFSTYRDHHWFSRAEAERELDLAAHHDATLVLTAKDAVRWPLPAPQVAVIDVAWEWVIGGEGIESLVFDHAVAGGSGAAASHAEDAP